MAIAMKELTAIGTVAEELSSLNKDQIRRAIEWLIDYFDIYEDEYGMLSDDDDVVVEPTVVAVQPVVEVADDDDDWEDDEDDFEEPASPTSSFANLYAHVNPRTNIQKAVTAAYWLQVVEGNPTWKSFDLSKCLREIGVKLSSISGTLAIDEKKETPLVAQLQKSGDSMQARKTFELTEAGIAFVQDRLA